MTVNPSDIQGLPGEGESVGNAMIELLQDLAEGGGGGGITEITSTDMSVTITDPTGPTVDLSASGGSQPGALAIKDYLFNEPALNSYPITAVSLADDTSLTVAGDHVAQFTEIGSFAIVGSTGNDSSYDVTSAVLLAGNTVVTPSFPLADATPDGSVEIAAKASLSATFDVPAGATVLDIWLYPLAAPWAGTDGINALLLVGDGAAADSWYADPFNLVGTLTDPYDPTSVGLSNFRTERDSENGIYANGVVFHGISPSQARAGGVRYPAGDTITMSVSEITGGGGGQLLVRIVYMGAITPVVAT